MRLKKGSIASFAQRARESGKGIVVYGAGVIGGTAAPYWLHEYALDEAVLCYVDADARKQGTAVRLGNRAVPVEPLSALEERRGTYLLLITVSAFEPVVKALEQLPGTEDAETWFLPVMLLDHAHAPKEGVVVKTSETPLIPKKIHYTWFSGEPIPENLQACIDSWKRFCPDYEIIRWDADHYDVSKYEYTRQAYELRKWGFIADVARLDILFENGGIYLDVDVELIRNLDELLYQPAFCGVEKWGTVNMGGASGACPQNPVVKAMLDHRKNEPFVFADQTLNLTTCGHYETFPLVREGLKLNGATQEIAGGMMTVYASEFFQPFDYMSGETRLTSNTFSIHHFSGTWLGPEAAEKRRETQLHYHQFLDRLEETV